ncbi:hypothetical protein Tco_1366643, partial [Tanacetum coccineum]
VKDSTTKRLGCHNASLGVMLMWLALSQRYDTAPPALSSALPAKLTHQRGGKH